MVSRMSFTSPRGAALAEELIARARAAVSATINEQAAQIYERSQVEVPKDPRHAERAGRPGKPQKSLEESGRVLESTPESLVAYVVYEHPAAAAQHEGEMTYESKEGKPVEWVVQRYSTPGTKRKYLEDPGKAAMALAPKELAVQGRLHLERGLP